jgi:hypothetical protein
MGKDFLATKKRHFFATLIFSLTSMLVFSNTSFIFYSISSSHQVEQSSCQYCIFPDLDFANQTSGQFIIGLRTDSNNPVQATLKLTYDGIEIKPKSSNTGKGSFRVSFDKLSLPSKRITISAQAVGSDGVLLGSATFVVRRNKYYLNLINYTSDCTNCTAIKVEPMMLDLGYIKYKSADSHIVSFTNQTDKSQFFTVTANQPWISFPNGNQFNLAPNEKTTAKISINWNHIEQGQFHQSRLTLYSKTVKIEFPAAMFSLVDMPECITVNTSTLDFPYVPRAKTAEKTINISGKGEFEITSNEGFVDINPKTIKDKGTVKISIRGGRLPAGASHKAKIVILPKSACQLAQIQLTVTTDEKMIMELWAGSKTPTINGVKTAMDVPAQIIGGSTMVPIRFISESFGADVAWNQYTKTITITRIDKQIILTVGKNTASIDGKEATLSKPPVVVGGRTLVPLRFISEAFGAKVEWNSDEKKVTIDWEPL